MYTEKTEQAQIVFRLVSYLLQYPNTAWKESLADFHQVVETLNHEAIAASLKRFLHNVEQTGIDTLSEIYVHTFDFSKKTNLYVTYARHGEQRERGPALLKLKQYYAENGLDMVDDELSDYLPLMLEFASEAPLVSVGRLLGEHRPAIEDIREQLVARDSLYVYLFDAIRLAMDELNIQLVAEGGAVS